jgi:hypothetical protein
MATVHYCYEFSPENKQDGNGVTRNTLCAEKAVTRSADGMACFAGVCGGTHPFGQRDLISTTF